MATNILLESGTNELEILEFLVGGNSYGINVAKVEEIIGSCEIREVPSVQPCVEGVFRRRGNVYTAINLAKYLHLQEKHEKDIFLITHFNQVSVAFRVDEIKMIHHLCWTDIQEPDKVLEGGQNGLITGIAKLDNNEMILILDFEKMLFEINPSIGMDEKSMNKIETSAHGKIPILMVEDSPFLRKLILECLTGAGFKNITAAANGQEAWEILSKLRETPDKISQTAACIITDIEMPQLDGLALTKRIKDDPQLSKIPVIVFSSMIDDNNSRKCTEVGANAQLSKPDIVRLVACIDELLRD